MPVWLIPVSKFIGQRFLHFLIYVIIGLAVWGVYHKLFVAPTNKIEKQVNIYSDGGNGRVPIFGCAAWRIQNETYWKKSVPVQGGEK